MIYVALQAKTSTIHVVLIYVFVCYVSKIHIKVLAYWLNAILTYYIYLFKLCVNPKIECLEYNILF